MSGLASRLERLAKGGACAEEAEKEFWRPPPPPPPLPKTPAAKAEAIVQAQEEARYPHSTAREKALRARLFRQRMREPTEREAALFAGVPPGRVHPERVRVLEIDDGPPSRPDPFFVSALARAAWLWNEYGEEIAPSPSFRADVKEAKRVLALLVGLNPAGVDPSWGSNDRKRFVRRWSQQAHGLGILGAYRAPDAWPRVKEILAKWARKVDDAGDRISDEEINREVEKTLRLPEGTLTRYGHARLAWMTASAELDPSLRGNLDRLTASARAGEQRHRRHRRSG